MKILSDMTHTARKFYHCDACYAWVDSGLGESDVTADEWLVVQAAEADGWKIRASTKYRKVVIKDAELRTFRFRLDMDALCQRNELYDEC